MTYGGGNACTVRHCVCACHAVTRNGEQNVTAWQLFGGTTRRLFTDRTGNRKDHRGSCSHGNRIHWNSRLISVSCAQDSKNHEWFGETLLSFIITHTPLHGFNSALLMSYFQIPYPPTPLWGDTESAFPEMWPRHLDGLGRSKGGNTDLIKFSFQTRSGCKKGENVTKPFFVFSK